MRELALSGLGDALSRRSSADGFAQSLCDARSATGPPRRNMQRLRMPRSGVYRGTSREQGHRAYRGRNQMPEDRQLIGTRCSDLELPDTRVAEAENSEGLLLSEEVRARRHY